MNLHIVLRVKRKSSVCCVTLTWLLMLAVYLSALIVHASIAAAQDVASQAAAFALSSIEAAAFDGFDANWQAALAGVVAADADYLSGPSPYTLTAFDT